MICEACGESNRPGTEFCAFCGSYLAWDPSAPDRSMVRPAPTKAAPAPASAPVPPASTPASTPPPASAPPPVRSAAASPPPVVNPEPVARPVAAAPNVAAADSPCPSCGRANPPGRRFCAHCGHQLISGGAAAAAPASPAPVAARGFRAWWARRFEGRDRAARRAYRRSLPTLYRWRRALIGLGLVAGLVAGLAVAGRNPVGFVRARYYDVRGTTVIVPVSTAAVEPPDATVPKSEPAALTDRTVAAWTMRWEPTAAGASCGGSPNTGVIVLTLPPTRIRTLGITAGLPEADGRRLLQARPRALGVVLDRGSCQPFLLTDTDKEQVLKLDSKVPVSEVRIGVDSATPLPEGGEPALSFTEITIRARPN